MPQSQSNVTIPEGVDKLLTIDVALRTRIIVEARGHYNELPTQRSMDLLRRWAGRAGLQIPSYFNGSG